MSVPRHVPPLGQQVVVAQSCTVRFGVAVVRRLQTNMSVWLSGWRDAVVLGREAQ